MAVESKNKKKIIPGGIAARKGLTSSDFPPKKVREGAKVEMEHTSNPEIAKEISVDHLTEHGTGYYPELKKMEEKLEAKSAALLDNHQPGQSGSLRKFKDTIAPSLRFGSQPSQHPDNTPMPGIPTTGPEGIQLALSNLDLDDLEAQQMEVVKSHKKTHRSDAVKILGYIQGFRRSGIHPRDLVLNRVPVIPPQFRPFSVAGDTFVPGDANELYRDLINVCGSHRELEGILGAKGAAQNKLHVQNAVRACYGYGDPTSPKTKERGVGGFLKKIVGVGPKFSYSSRRLLSRNQDYVGRSVIGVDPNLKLDEIAIPEEMAWKLYAPYIQRRLVRGGMSPGDAVKAIRDRSPLALKHLELEMPGHPVMYSRAPAWHKFSALGAYPKMVKGDAIMINPLVTSGLGADFNGDSCVLDYGFVPVIIDGKLVLEDFKNLLVRYITPGISEDMFISEFGVGTQIFQFAPGRFQVLGLKPDGSPGWVDAAAISVHTSHSDACSHVTSLRGLSATFTSHHNFIRLNAECDLEAVKTEEIKVGDLLPMAHKFDLPVAELPKDSPRPLVDNFQMGFWFGYYLGDGSITGRVDTVSQACVDPTTLSYLEEVGKSFFAETPWREGNGFSTRWTSKPWVNFLLREIGVGAAGKHVPAWMLGLSQAFKHGLIAGFFAAEGNVSKATVRVETVNPSMLVTFRMLLESMGVPCSVKPGKAAKLNRQATYVLRASGAQIAALGIAWPDTGKCKQFKALTTEVGRTPHWDRVPFPTWLKDVFNVQGNKFEGGRGRHKTHARVGTLVPDFKQSKKAFKLGYASRLHAIRAIEGYNLDEVEDARVQKWIKLVRDTGINWDMIDNIVPCERPLVTYDFSVPGAEAFAIMGGFLTHNTCNVHLPSMPEAIQDVKEKLMPSKMLWSIKDPEKVVPITKQEQILGLYAAQHSPSRQKVQFRTQQDALAAIKRGDVSLSDEIEIK